jgi:2-keto-4-pentenoate hydratase/2-oxohepta-3-ene-1,7-dioic acid hydratase in catechol pathway
MKLLTGLYKGKSFIGLLTGEKSVIDLNAVAEHQGKDFPDHLLTGIKQGDVFLSEIKALSSSSGVSPYTYGMDEVILLSPIPRPHKNIFCVGKNYRDHAIEMGSEADIPEHIMVFSKAPTTVLGHNAGIPLHAAVTSELDYEGELAVVIGKTGMGISKEEAMDHVFGYTIINDITARDLQQKHKQFLIGKSLDGTCPMGPYIVHHSEITDPHKLAIETKVNGEVRQNGNTSDFIFDIPTMIYELSKGMTLEAGDIIATGTPAGVGKGLKPPLYLKEGDTVEISIEGIGTLRNEIVG